MIQEEEEGEGRRGGGGKRGGGRKKRRVNIETQTQSFFVLHLSCSPPGELHLTPRETGWILVPNQDLQPSADTCESSEKVERGDEEEEEGRAMGRGFNEDLHPQTSGEPRPGGPSEPRGGGADLPQWRPQHP